MRRRLAGLLVAVVVGAAACSQPPRSQESRPTGGPTRPPVGAGVAGDGSPHPDAGHAGPATVVDGAPMGYRHDSAGARAAGLAFTRLNQELVGMAEERALAARRAMASGMTADALAEQLRAELAELRKRWPAGSITYQVVPLATRVKDTGADAVRVDVWYLGVVSGQSLQTYEEWVTDTYHLVWERDDWRVAALSDAPGPRPAPGAQPTSSSAEIEARLSGLEAVR